MAKGDSEPGQTRETIAKLRAEVERLSDLIEYFQIKGQKYLTVVEEARHTPNADHRDLIRLEEQSVRNNGKLEALVVKVEELRAAIEVALKTNDKPRSTTAGNDTQKSLNPDL